MAFDIGTHVGRYVILRPLGRGAAGLVFVAFDPQLDREVALKLLRPRGKDGDGTAQQRLLEEAQALASLSHPHVVDVYDVGTWEDQVYIALEYVEGQTLAEWAQQGKRSLDEIVEVFCQAAQGLAAAHAAGIVHLDFKPSNVIVDAAGFVRVLDFGLARRQVATQSSTGSGGEDLSISGTSGSDSRSYDGPDRKLSGTPGYIAPETYVGADPGPAADQFALCVSLWEVLHRERPFDGESQAEIRDAVLRGVPRSPTRRVPRSLDKVLRRGLQTSPQQRFESMAALEAALQRGRGRRNIWLMVAGAMPLVAVGGYAYARSLGDDSGLCQAGPSRFAEAWSQEDRSRIRSQFVASGELYAPRTFELVVGKLDGYRDDWVSEYLDACRATRLLGEQSEQLLDLRMSCLDERRLAVAALVDVLEQADASVVERAPPALERLPSLSGCSDREGLMRRTNTAQTPEQGERFDAMVRELAAVEALALTEDLTAAMARAEAVLAEAKSLGAGEHEARAHLALAGFWERRGEIDRAIEHCNDALFVADAVGADDSRADAALALMWFYGHVKADYERSQWFANVARTVISRLDDPEPRRITLVENQAGVAVDEGRYEEAIQMFEDVLAQTGDEVSYAQSVRLSSLAAAYFNAGRYEDARGAYQRSLKMRTEILGPQHPYVGDLLCDLAMVDNELGESETAVADMRKGLALMENAKGPTENSLRIIHNNFAVILQDLGRYQEAAEYYRKALRGWREFEPEHTMVGLLLANLADLEIERKHYAAAEKYATESLKHFSEHELPEDHPYFAYALTARGRALLGQGEAERAVEQLRSAVAILRGNRGDTHATADALESLADALEATDGPSEEAEALRAEARGTKQGSGK